MSLTITTGDINCKENVGIVVPGLHRIILIVLADLTHVNKLVVLQNNQLKQAA